MKYISLCCMSNVGDSLRDAEALNIEIWLQEVIMQF